MEEAITAGLEARRATPSDHPDRAAILSNLSVAMHARFAYSGSPMDVAVALTIVQEAMAVPFDDHPDRAAILSNFDNVSHAETFPATLFLVSHRRRIPPL